MARHTTKVTSLQVLSRRDGRSRLAGSAARAADRAARTATIDETDRGEELRMSTLRFQPEAARFYAEGHWRSA